MGKRAARSVAHINWERIVSTLLRAATAPSGATVAVRSAVQHAASKAPAPVRRLPTKVTVLDMQPIDPAVGGGRLRLLGLYHNLGADAPTTYVGTYDWPGPGYRDHRLTPTLREIDVPLSDRHFAASDEWRRISGGKTVIDASFAMLAHHSPEFVRAARDAACSADVVVFSHPWVYPLVHDVLRRREQLIVYDAQNVESVLRYRLLADTEIGLRIVRHATGVERELCRRADLVLACSHEDRDLFHRLYEIPFAKCLVMPNGTFVGQAPSETGRREKRRLLGVDDKPLAIFIGSPFRPTKKRPTSSVQNWHRRCRRSPLPFAVAWGTRSIAIRSRTAGSPTCGSPARSTTPRGAITSPPRMWPLIRCFPDPAPTSRCSISWRPACR